MNYYSDHASHEEITRAIDAAYQLAAEHGWDADQIVERYTTEDEPSEELRSRFEALELAAYEAATRGWALPDNTSTLAL